MGMRQYSSFSVVNEWLTIACSRMYFIGYFFIQVFYLFFCAIIGAKYGNICVNDVLYSSHSISLHITELADEYRTKVRQELIEPLENQAVTI